MTVLEREGYIAQPHTLGRPHPDRPGLPLLRRPLAPPARPLPQQRRVSPTSSPRRTSAAGGPAPRDAAAPARAHHPHGRRDRARRPTRPGPQRPARRAAARLVLAVAVLSQRRRSRRRSSSTLDDDATDDASPRRTAIARRRTCGGSPPSRRRTRRAGCRRRATRSPTRSSRRCATASASTPATAASRSTSAARSRIAAEQDGVRGRTNGAPACSSCSSSQVVVVSLVRDLLDPGLTVRIGAENDARRAPRLLARARARTASRASAAGTVGVLGPTRMDYQQALAAVAAVSQQLGSPPLGEPAPMPADHYDDRSASAATRPTTRSSAPTASWRASTTPTRTGDDPGGGGAASRRSPVAYETLRDPERRRRYDMFGDEGRARRRGRPGAATRSASATSSTRSSAATRSAAGGHGPGPRAPGRRGGRGARPRRGRVRRHRDPRAAHARRVRALRRLRLRAGHPPGRAATPAAARARCARCGARILGQIVTARAVRRVRTAPARRSPPRAATAAATAGSRRPRAASTSRCRPASTTASGSALAGRGPAAPRGGMPGDLYVTRARRARTRCSSAHGYDLVHQRRDRDDPGRRSAPCSPSRRSTGPRSSPSRRAPSPARLPAQGSRASRCSRAAAAATCSCRSTSTCPEELTGEEQELLTQFAELRGEKVARRRGRVLLEDPLGVR